MDYNITLEKEVIREMSANCLAVIYRYLKSKGISEDDSDPIAIADKKISTIYSEVIGGKDYETMESLYIARGQIEMTRYILKELMGE